MAPQFHNSMSSPSLVKIGNTATRRDAARIAAGLLLAITIAVTARWSAVAVARQTPSTQPAASVLPLDVLLNSYAPFTDAKDPLGFPLKIDRITKNPYRFWRGAKDLFYKEAAVDDADWLADRSTYRPCHGDVHAGNFGTYLTDAGFGEVAFGVIDFDDSAPLPPQIDLMQAIVSLDLAMDEAATKFSAADRHAAAELLIQSYDAAIRSGQSALELLSDDKGVQKMAKRAKAVQYSEELEHLVDSDAFRHSFKNKAGEVKEILRPEPRESFNDFADAIAAGVAASEHADRFQYHTSQEWRGAILDVAKRSRIDSAGSQGLAKYLVLVDHPLVNDSTRLILYLKQQIPSAAARQKLIPEEPRPGDRCRALAAALSQPHPWLNTDAVLRDGRSFYLSLKEPWGEDLNAENLKSIEDVSALARRCGVGLGVAHRNAGHPSDWLTTTMQAAVTERATKCVERVKEDYRALLSDPRTEQYCKTAEDALRTFGRD